MGLLAVGCSIVGIGALVIGAGAACYGANQIEYSEGARVGVVNKFSEQGLFCKTYDGQMALEGVRGGDRATAANVWEFSLDNWQRHGENKGDLVKKLNEALDSGKRVKLTYVQTWGEFPCRSDSGYMIQNVEYSE